MAAPTGYRMFWSFGPAQAALHQDVDNSGTDKGLAQAELWYADLKKGWDPSSNSPGEYLNKSLPDTTYYSVGVLKLFADSTKVSGYREEGFHFWQNPDWVAQAEAPKAPQTVYKVFYENYEDGYAAVKTFSEGTYEQVKLAAHTYYNSLFGKASKDSSGFGWKDEGSGKTVTSKYDRISSWNVTDLSKPDLIEGWDRKWNNDEDAKAEDNPFLSTTPNTTPPVKTEDKKTEDKKTDKKLAGSTAGGIVNAAVALKEAMDKTLESFKQRVTAPEYAGGPIAQAAADEMAEEVKVAFEPIADDLAKAFQQSIQDALKGLNLDLGKVAADLNPVTWLQKWWEDVRQTFATMLVGGVVIIIVAAGVYYFWKRSSPEAQMNELFRMQMQQQIIKGMEWSRTPEGAQTIGQASGVAAGTAAKVLI